MENHYQLNQICQFVGLVKEGWGNNNRTVDNESINILGNHSSLMQVHPRRFPRAKQL